MGREALLISDMLNDFVLEGAPLEVPETRKVIPNIKREIESAKANGIPVIYICDTHDPQDIEFSNFGWPPHGVKGTKGALVVDELKPDENDILIEKTTYSSFFNTKLDETLKKLGIESIRITGCVTHICVLFAAYEAAIRNYKVTVVQDAVAGLAQDDSEAAFRLMKNILGVKVV